MFQTTTNENENIFSPVKESTPEKETTSEATDDLLNFGEFKSQSSVVSTHDQSSSVGNKIDKDDTVDDIPISDDILHEYYDIIRRLRRNRCNLDFSSTLLYEPHTEKKWFNFLQKNDKKLNFHLTNMKFNRTTVLKDKDNKWTRIKWKLFYFITENQISHVKLGNIQKMFLDVNGAHLKNVKKTFIDHIHKIGVRIEANDVNTKIFVKDQRQVEIEIDIPIASLVLINFGFLKKKSKSIAKNYLVSTTLIAFTTLATMAWFQYEINRQVTNKQLDVNRRLGIIENYMNQRSDYKSTIERSDYKSTID
jgi:hypothetical protein